MSIPKRKPAGFRPIVWGLLIGAFGLFMLAALVVGQTALSYDGDCGGLLPFMGESRECSLWEYLMVWLPFNFEIIFYSYWHVLLVILFLPSAILSTYYSYALQRARRPNLQGK